MNIGVFDDKPLVHDNIKRIIESFKNDKFLELELIHFSSAEELLRCKYNIVG